MSFIYLSSSTTDLVKRNHRFTVALSMVTQANFYRYQFLMNTEHYSNSEHYLSKKCGKSSITPDISRQSSREWFHCIPEKKSYGYGISTWLALVIASRHDAVHLVFISNLSFFPFHTF